MKILPLFNSGAIKDGIGGDIFDLGAGKDGVGEDIFDSCAGKDGVGEDILSVSLRGLSGKVISLGDSGVVSRTRFSSV